MKVNIYNQQGEKTGTEALPDTIFGLKWNPELVWQVVESERANKRRGTAHTKGRGEVRGGGRKPWRQKGTGRARHGSIRSPIWIGGGVTHGPRKEKSYEKKINKKMKLKAFFSVLSQKLRDNEIVFLEDASIQSAKTKAAAAVIKSLSRIDGFEKFGVKGSIFVALPKHDTQTIRAFRNIRDTSVGEVRNMNASIALSHRYIIMPKESVKILEARLKK